MEGESNICLDSLVLKIRAKFGPEGSSVFIFPLLGWLGGSKRIEKGGRRGATKALLRNFTRRRRRENKSPFSQQQKGCWCVGMRGEIWLPHT